MLIKGSRAVCKYAGREHRKEMGKVNASRQRVMVTMQRNGERPAFRVNCDDEILEMVTWTLDSRRREVSE